MADNITIQGVQDVMRTFDKAPGNLLKMTKSAMREASKGVVKQIRAGVPDRRFRRMVKAKIVTSYQGETSALIGLFNGHQRAGHQTATGVDDWFKAYWKNYGTLTHRDPTHTFTKPVKRATSRRRNNVGQQHENFFEASVEGYEKRFFDSFQDWVTEHEKQLIDR